jgi:hypothetical protein
MTSDFGRREATVTRMKRTAARQQPPTDAALGRLGRRCAPDGGLENGERTASPRRSS